MITVAVPSLMRDLTDGRAAVTVAGLTVAEVIAALDRDYPGVRERLLVNSDLDPTLTVVVDGHVAPLRLRARLRENSRVQFVPTISGG